MFLIHTELTEFVDCMFLLEFSFSLYITVSPSEAANLLKNLSLGSQSKTFFWIVERNVTQSTVNRHYTVNVAQLFFHTLLCHPLKFAVL